MNKTLVAKELLAMAKELVAAPGSQVRQKMLLWTGTLSVSTGIYGISCSVTGDPKMTKREFVGRYYKKVAEFMDDFDRERHIIGTINTKKAMSQLDSAFRWWVDEAIKRGEMISAKTMERIDRDDGGDNFGKMWKLRAEAEAAGYVLQNGYYVKV